MLTQELEVGVKRMWKRCASQAMPSLLDACAWPRGVVVDDQMQLKLLGRFAIDLLVKFQPFLIPVLSLDGADQASLKIVKRREQGDGAMTDIIVLLRAYMTDPQRQSKLSTLQSLNLAFFIATEH